MSASPGFTVWDMPSSELQLRSPTGASYALEQGTVMYESLSLWRGALVGEGPGLVVTSYDPQNLIKVEDGNGHSMQGLLSIANETINGFVKLIAEHEGVSIGKVAHRHGLGLSTSQYDMRDALLNCSGVYVPAIRFIVGPPVNVLISADLLGHSVTMASWGGVALDHIPRLEPNPSVAMPPVPKLQHSENI